jgi:enamine deaminase RidA (YjgF/YER057c/UK114 family)
VLGEACAELSDIVTVTIIVADISQLDVITKLRGEYLREPYPADTLMRVAGLLSRTG